MLELRKGCLDISVLLEPLEIASEKRSRRGSRGELLLLLHGQRARPCMSLPRCSVRLVRDLCFHVTLDCCLLCVLELDPQFGCPVNGVVQHPLSLHGFRGGPLQLLQCRLGRRRQFPLVRYQAALTMATSG